MVSSPFSLLRTRRAARRAKKSEEITPSQSINTIIPPVVVIEEVATPSSSDTTPPPEVTLDTTAMPSTVTQVLVESVPTEPEEPQVANGTTENGQPESPRPVIVDDDEEIGQCGCSEALTNGLSKVKTVVEEIPPEYKEAAKYSGLATMSLIGLFVSIVLYRCVKHFMYPEEESFFCSYFSRPFAPMFDALCHQDKKGLVTELSEEAHHLANELHTAIYNFVTSIFAGFRAFGTIFWALFGGILQVVSSGLHELIENVSENVAFLLKFCCDFANSLLHIFFKMITGTIDQIGIAFSSLIRIF